MIENLTHENFILYAAKYYNSIHYVESEFFSDLKKFKYIKRLITKYNSTGDIKYRLLLNHIIMVYNVFETDACTKMLFLKNNKNDYHILKTFLVYLNFMPDVITNINGKNIISSDIGLDFNIVNILRDL